MPRFKLGLIGLLLWSAVAYAAPCGSATLFTYVGLGGTGCTVGPFLFKDFGFSVISTTGSPAILSVTDINVTVVTSPNHYGLNYAPSPSSAGFSLTSGQSIDYLLSYTVYPPPPIIWGEELDMFTNTPVAPGKATITSSECIGAPCGVPTVSHSVLHHGGTDFHLTDVLPIVPNTGILGVQTHIVLDATLGGSSSFTSFTEQVVIPEPGTLALCTLASALILLRNRRNR